MRALRPFATAPRAPDVNLSAAVAGGAFAAWWVLTFSIVAGILLGGHANKHEALESSIGRVESVIEKVDSAVEEVGSAVGQMASDVGDVKSAVSRIDSFVGEIESRVGGVESSVDVGRVEFDTALHAVDDAGQRKAVEAAARAVGKRSGDILVLGFADSCGPAAANLNLSERRAESVAVALMEQLRGRTIHVIGMGESVGAFGNGRCDSQWHRSARVILLAPFGTARWRSSLRPERFC